MRDEPIQKKESHETKHRKKDLVPENSQMKGYADQLVSNAFSVWGDNLSESEGDL